jgi:succinylglutamate desuccinylase
VKGPTVVVLAGIHGNEPAGVQAARRVLTALQRDRLPFAGELVAVAGNLQALHRAERFVERDLNRQWLGPQVESLRHRPAELDGAEDAEQRDLLRIFDRCVAEAAGPLLFVDLHTSSADGPPFCCLGDTLPNRRIALSLEIPVILGLEQTIDGAVLEYFNERGLAAIAIEGGRHEAPQTVERLEAAIWLALVAAGTVAEAVVPDLGRCRAVLREASRGVPPVVEIRAHHKLAVGDEFTMQPGFTSFQRVRRGELLARDRRGPIHAREAGRVLLPLYQGKGDDGFFLCRDVRPFWLAVARWVRRARLDLVLPLLPGVRRHPERRDALAVDPRIARWLVREVFHLLGYRRCRPDGDRLLFTRRRVAPVTRLLPWAPPLDRTARDRADAPS